MYILSMDSWSNKLSVEYTRNVLVIKTSSSNAFPDSCSYWLENKQADK